MTPREEIRRLTVGMTKNQLEGTRDDLIEMVDELRRMLAASFKEDSKPLIPRCRRRLRDRWGRN